MNIKLDDDNPAELGPDRHCLRCLKCHCLWEGEITDMCPMCGEGYVEDLTLA